MKRHTFLLAVFVFTFVSFFTFSASIHAQLVWDPESGVPVRGCYETHAVLELPGHNPGEGLLIWADPRTGDWDLHGQLLDANGNFLWEDGGRPLVVAPGHQFEVQGVVLDDGWLLVWMDTRGEDNTVEEGAIYMQRFDLDGNPLWTNPPEPAQWGVPLFEDNRRNYQMELHLDDNGELFIAAAQNENNEGHCEVRLFRILTDDGSRDPVWPYDGELLNSRQDSPHRSYYSLFLSGDDDTGVLVGWMKYRRNHFYGRYDMFGEPVWDSIREIDVHSDGLEYCSDGEGGVFFFDEVYLGNWNWQLRTQRLLADGTFAGPQSGYNLTPIRDFRMNILSLTPSAPGSAILIWENRHGGDFRYSAQRFDGVDDPLRLWGFEQQFAEVDIDYSIPDPDGGVTTVPYLPGTINHISADGCLRSIDAEISFNSSRRLVNSIGSHVAITGEYEDGQQQGLRYHLYNAANNTLPLPVEGITVQQSLRMEVSHNASTGLLADADHAYVVWGDNRQSYPPFIQKMDLESGTIQFQQDGEPVFPAYLNDPTVFTAYNMNVLQDDDGYIYTVTENSEAYDTGACINLQKSTSDNVALWGDYGIRMPASEEDGINIHGLTAVLDGSGGLYVLFQERIYNPNQYIACIAHFDENGQPTFQQGDNDYITLFDCGDYFYPDGFKYWSDHQQLAFTYQVNGVLRAVSLDESGEILWNEQLMVGVWDTSQASHVLFTDDRIILMWIDQNRALHGQALYLDGSPAWGEEGLEFTADDDLYIHAVDLAGPDDSSFWMVTSFGADDNETMWVMRYNLDGTPAFNRPVVLCGDDTNVQLLGQEEGSAYIAYRKRDVNDDWALYCGRIGSNGEHGDLSYTRIENAEHYEVYPKNMVSDGDGGVVVSWIDSRLDGTDHGGLDALYAQRVYLPLPTMNSVDEAVHPQEFALEPVYPNPFNAMATVSLTMPVPGELDVALYNILGQRVLTVWHGAQTIGNHRFVLDATQLSSGLYFVKASVPDRATRIQKVMLVR